jgi:uncharacterized glyoxalase superfamily protein PhnB
VAKAIAFYQRAFGAVVREGAAHADGRVGHAELSIGDARILLADEVPEAGFRAPPSLGGSSVIVHLAVADLDGVFLRARDAGARVLEPVAEADGGRRGKLEDPFGHVWVLAAVPTPPVPSEVARLWERLDLITPFALRVVATLRVADHLIADPRPVEDLAARVGADADALRRLLRYLMARGVFAETGDGRFALTELAHPLRDDHPSGTRRWLDLEGFGGTMDLSFVDLLSTVRAGRSPRALPESGLTDALSASFDDVMEAQSRQQAPAIVAGWEWSAATHVVDVGGGTGTLLVSLLREHAALRGTLVELPRTAVRARRLLAGEGLAGRCAVVSGDLFDLALPTGDVYLLKFVLHGLENEQAILALTRCRAAGGPTAHVLVVERSVASGDDRAAFSAMDLRMLVLGTGRERTLEEYATLAAAAGLRLHRATPTPVGVHLIDLVADR